MSRGHGYLQRRIMRIVERGGATTRAALEDHLEPEGYRSDNVLRAVRGLSRAGQVEYREARFPSNCTIRPPRPIGFSDEELGALLAEPGWKPSPGTLAPTHRKHPPQPTPRRRKEPPSMGGEVFTTG